MFSLSSEVLIGDFTVSQLLSMAHHLVLLEEPDCSNTPMSNSIKFSQVKQLFNLSNSVIAPSVIVQWLSLEQSSVRIH